MKILFVAPRFHTNQAPFVRGLLDAGHEVAFDVLTYGGSEDHSGLKPTVVPLSVGSRLWFRMRRPENGVTHHADYSFPSIAWTWQRLRTLRPDVVVVRDPNRPFSTLTAIAARLQGIRVLLYTQGPVRAAFDRRKSVMRSLMLAVLDADWYSPVLGAAHHARVDPRVHYLPFAADLKRSVKSTWFAGNAVHVLAIGKFESRKNHLLMLRAFDRVRRERRVRLTLVGEVTTDEHRRYHMKVVDLIEKLGLQGLVRLRINVPFAELEPLYLAHDLFVLPSRDEPASVSVLEAMTHGLPVICSSTCGTQWYIAPGRSGWVFTSDDVEDLTARLGTALRDRDRLVSMGAEARHVAATVHAPDLLVQRFESLASRRLGRAAGALTGSQP